LLPSLAACYPSVKPEFAIASLVARWRVCLVTPAGSLRDNSRAEMMHMNAADVIDFYTELHNLGITIWIDGGWGVEALLGEPIRPHEDLDIAIEQKDVPALKDFLAPRGYREIERASEWNFVLSDSQGREIDVHAFILDAQGNVEEGIPYPAGSLTGTGMIAGHAVRCIAADWVVKFHCGYPPKEKDFNDVSALCEKFGINLPLAYAQFKKSH
jgi:lincosamide nucleotidyltransferase A/C/D/E